MTSFTQADRQWLDQLYSKSPSSALDYWIFRSYYRLRQVWAALGETHRPIRQGESAQISSSCDRYGNVLWHVCDPVRHLSFNTYSHQELQDWLRNHYPAPDQAPSDQNHPQWLSGGDG